MESLFLILVGIIMIVSPIAGAYWWRRKKNAKLQAKLVEKLKHKRPGLLDGGATFQVHFASQKSINSMFKLTAWEGNGLVVIKEDTVYFANGKTVEVTEFKKGEAEVDWVGRVWQSGRVEWIVMESGNNKVYLTTDLTQ